MFSREFICMSCLDIHGFAEDLKVIWADESMDEILAVGSPELAVGKRVKFDSTDPKDPKY